MLDDQSKGIRNLPYLSPELPGSSPPSQTPPPAPWPPRQLNHARQRLALWRTQDHSGPRRRSPQGCRNPHRRRNRLRPPSTKATASSRPSPRPERRKSFRPRHGSAHRSRNPRRNAADDAGEPRPRPGPERKKLAELELTKAQVQVVKALAAASGPVPLGQLIHAIGCSQSPVDSLRHKGHVLVTVGRVESKRQPTAAVPRQEPWILNPDQQKALDTILAALRSQEHQTILVHGVTGSGKTEVYIQAIEEVVIVRAAGDRAGARKSASRRRRSSGSARGSTGWPCCTAI